MSSNLHNALAQLIRDLPLQPGEPVHFPDNAHNDPQVLSIFSDPEIIHALQARGISGLALEGNPKLNAFSTPQDLVSVLAEDFVNRFGKENGYALAEAYRAVFSQQSDVWQVAFIDTNRAQKMDELFTGREKELYIELQKSLQKRNSSQALDDYFLALSPEDRKQAITMSRKLNAIIGGSQYASEISEQIHRRFSGGAVATHIGAIHYASLRDVDEFLPGKTIAIVSDTNSSRRNSEDQELPDYAYYVREDRVERLNNAPAIAEYLQRSNSSQSENLAEQGSGQSLTAGENQYKHEESALGTFSPPPTPSQNMDPSKARSR